MDAIIVRRNPDLTVVPGFFDEIDDLATSLWNDWTPTVYEVDTCSMPVDMYELKEELVIKAELPGFKKEDMDISVEGDQLTVKATRKPEEKPEKVTNYVCEISHGDYLRTMTLPFSVDHKKVSASFENGILEIRLPRSAQLKPKHIEIASK